VFKHVLPTRNLSLYRAFTGFAVFSAHYVDITKTRKKTQENAAFVASSPTKRAPQWLDTSPIGILPPDNIPAR